MNLPEIPEFTWTYLNLPKFTWIYLNLPKFTWIYLNGFTEVHFGSLGFDWVNLVGSGRLGKNGSHCIGGTRNAQTLHCLIVTFRGTYEQQALSNSRTRKVDQKVLQEQYLCTSGRWFRHLTIFSAIKNTKHIYIYIFVVILRFFLNFKKSCY